VLARYKTKDQVRRSFGVPTKKVYDEDNYEVWIYDFGSTDISTTSASAYRNWYGGISGGSSTVASTYNRYLKYTFHGDYVVRYESNGVDYTEREYDPKKTKNLLLWSGIGTVVIILLSLIWWVWIFVLSLLSVTINNVSQTY
jgi:hypothetical protein